MLKKLVKTNVVDRASPNPKEHEKDVIDTVKPAKPSKPPKVQPFDAPVEKEKKESTKKTVTGKPAEKIEVHSDSVKNQMNSSYIKSRL